MAFVVSEGALRKLEPPSTVETSWPSYSTMLGANRSATYGALYRSQPAIRTVVGFLARNIAQLGVHVYRRVSDTDRKRLADHPLAVLLGAPNPRTTAFKFMRALVSDVAIYDDAFLIKLRAEQDRTPLGLRRWPPERMETRGPDWLEPEEYRLHGSRGHLDLAPDQVVHLHGYNPDDARRGCPPIESLRQILAEEHAAAQWREQMWSNGARMSGYLERPSTAPEWGPAEKEKFRQQWQAQYTGDGPRAGGTPILEDGMRWVAAGVNPRDAQYVESRKLTREEVAAAYHIPQPFVGILENAHFNNIKEQHKSLYQDTLGPWCTEIEQEIGLQLIPDMPNNRRLYVEFNIAEKLKGSFEEQATQLQTAVGAPYMTRNEARSIQNLPQIEGGDELIVPLNVGTLGGDLEVDDDPDQQPDQQPALVEGTDPPEEAQDAD